MIHMFTKYPFRLIVVDNGSMDGSKEWLLEMKEKGLIWKTVFNTENKPLAEAFNEGLKEVESELCVTSANDMMVPYTKSPYGEDVCWLTMLVASINHYEDYGSINFFAPRQHLLPFRKKRWQHVKGMYAKDKNKMNKLHSTIFTDGKDYGLSL